MSQAPLAVTMSLTGHAHITNYQFASLASIVLDVGYSCLAQQCSLEVLFLCQIVMCH